MMKTKTRIPALILCFVLLLSVIPTLAASAATPIPTVNITGFRLPTVGQKAEDNLETLSVPAGAKYYISEAYWINTHSSLFVSPGDAFEEGIIYYLKVVVAPLSGYSVENAKPYFDGSQTYVDTGYTRMEGNTMVFYSVNLTAVKPTVINNVDLLGFRKPTPGQTAGANLASLSVPSNAKYSISDAYWVEVSSYSALSDTDVFEEGVTYFLSVYVEAKYGYTFTTGGTNPTFDGSQQYVDTAYCMVTSVDSYRIFSNDLVCTAPAKVPTVNVTGFKEPVAGQTVASNIASLKVPAGANYVITEAYWLDVVANKIVSGSDVFEAGRFYFLTVCLDPKDGYTLSGASAQLNGSKKDVDSDFCGIRGGEYEVVSIDYLVQPNTAKKGDINGDGIVNAFDYQMVKAYVLGTFPSATAQMITAMDVNGDGNINAFDYQMIKAAVLGTYTFS